jgi:hypothetical protein
MLRNAFMTNFDFGDHDKNNLGTNLNNHIQNDIANNLSMKKSNTALVLFTVFVNCNLVFGQVKAKILADDTTSQNSFCQLYFDVQVELTDTVAEFNVFSSNDVELEVQFQSDYTWRTTRLYSISHGGAFTIDNEERIYKTRRMIDLLPLIVDDTSLIDILSNENTPLSARFAVRGRLGDLAYQTFYSDTMMLRLPALSQQNINAIRFINNSDKDMAKDFCIGLYQHLSLEYFQEIYSLFPDSDLADMAKFYFSIMSHIERYGHRGEWNTDAKNEIISILENLLLDTESELIAKEIRSRIKLYSRP